MSAQTYDRIQNVCLLFVVGSAFLFTRAGDLSWVVGAVGIAGAIVSVATYFRYHWHR